MDDVSSTMETDEEPSSFIPSTSDEPSLSSSSPVKPKRCRKKIQRKSQPREPTQSTPKKKQKMVFAANTRSILDQASELNQIHTPDEYVRQLVSNLFFPV